jgi:hypothetical protein
MFLRGGLDRANQVELAKEIRWKAQMTLDYFSKRYGQFVSSIPVFPANRFVDQANNS